MLYSAELKTVLAQCRLLYQKKAGNVDNCNPWEQQTRYTKFSPVYGNADSLQLLLFARQEFRHAQNL